MTIPLRAIATAAVVLLACGPELAEPDPVVAEDRLSISNVQVSASADRSAASTLEGRTLSGPAYIFATDLPSHTREVSFYLDDAEMRSAPRHVERAAPWDFVGTGADGRAFPFDTATLTDGRHTLTVRVLRSRGRTEVRTVTFTVANEVVTTPALPNLVVNGISSVKGSGNAIVFRAELKNTGAAPTPAGTIHGVSFWVGGTQISWSDTHTAAVAPGESVTVTANGGPSGTAEWVPNATSFAVEAWVDDVKRMVESDETDNRLTQTLTAETTGTGTSEPSSCTDGVRGGAEVGVDCGGGCGPCELPFNPLPRSTLRKSAKKVFAHWHYYPVAINNVDPRSDYYTRSWMDPSGESGKHASYGGFMRERPVPRLPRSQSDWLLRDAMQDVQLAAAIGIDGFYLNMWTDSDTNNGGLWTRTTTMVDAAAAVGDFDIIPNFDISIMGGMSETDALNKMIAMLGKLRGKSALYRLSDGRFVVGAFRAEARSPAFFATFKKRAAAELQMNIHLVPVFLGTGTTHFSAFASVSDAFAGWGTAIPAAAGSAAKVKALAAGYGRPWIHPVSNQDFRPYNFKFWEAKNTQTLRSHWETVIADGIDQVQIITWNDHHEHHAIRPSTGKQWSAYDLTAYYIQWFKTGTRPALKRDVLYYSHRVHASSASFDTSKQEKAFTCVTGCPAVDEVELVAFLTAPGTLEITQGGATTRKDVTSGLNVLKAPLSTGRPTFRLVRAGVPVVSVQSAFTIRSSTTYQDLLYRGGSSARAAMSSSGSCAAYCEAGDTIRCELCPAEPMWLAAP